MKQGLMVDGAGWAQVAEWLSAGDRPWPAELAQADAAWLLLRQSETGQKAPSGRAMARRWRWTWDAAKVARVLEAAQQALQNGAARPVDLSVDGGMVPPFLPPSSPLPSSPPHPPNNYPPSFPLPNPPCHTVLPLDPDPSRSGSSVLSGSSKLTQRGLSGGEEEDPLQALSASPAPLPSADPPAALPGCAGELAGGSGFGEEGEDPAEASTPATVDPELARRKRALAELVAQHRAERERQRQAEQERRQALHAGPSIREQALLMAERARAAQAARDAEILSRAAPPPPAQPEPDLRPAPQAPVEIQEGNPPATHGPQAPPEPEGNGSDSWAGNGPLECVETSGGGQVGSEPERARGALSAQEKAIPEKRPCPYRPEDLTTEGLSGTWKRIADLLEEAGLSARATAAPAKDRPLLRDAVRAHGPERVVEVARWIAQSPARDAAWRRGTESAWMPRSWLHPDRLPALLAAMDRAPMSPPEDREEAAPLSPDEFAEALKAIRAMSP